MAIYLLEGTSSARLPRRPLMVSLSVGGNRTGVRLTARVEESGSTPAGLVQPSPGTLILPRVDQGIVISAVPEQGRPEFENGTVLHVSVGPDRNADLDADIAQLSPRDVSGLSSIELAVLSPAAADLIQVTTRLVERERQLPPVAARARVACRGALGVDRLPPAQQVPVSCVLDASASIATFMDNGAVAAAAQIVAGIAAVAGRSGSIDAALADGQGTRMQGVSGAELSGLLTDALRAGGYGLGADVKSAADGLGGPGGFTVIITDNPGPALRSASGADVVRLVISSSQSALTYPGFVGAICPTPPPGADAESFLTGQPHLVDQVVGDLVASLRNR